MIPCFGTSYRTKNQAKHERNATGTRFCLARRSLRHAVMSETALYLHLNYLRRGRCLWQGGFVVFIVSSSSGDMGSRFRKAPALNHLS
jgi:hypothetical protein